MEAAHESDEPSTRLGLRAGVAGLARSQVMKRLRATDLRGNFAELVRFAFVGATTAAIFVILVSVAEWWDLSSVSVTIGAYSAAITFQYLAHAKFTFRRRAGEPARLLRFLVINALGLGFSILMLDLAAPALSLPRAFASLLVVVILPVVNYLSFKLWAFRGPVNDQLLSPKDGTMSHMYDDTFFNYIEQGSFLSAKEVAPIVFGALKPASLLDVGSGRGAWAKSWGDAGVSDVYCVDGAYVDTEKLHIDPACFAKRDLSTSFDLERRFDLVTTLEVAEHLPPASSAAFVDSLTRHGEMILFSAAPPGQGGQHHVNERPLKFWRGLFAERGYQPFDFLRPQIKDNAQIEPWYRYNTILYVHEAAVERLPDSVMATAVRSDEGFTDFSTVTWRVRRAAVRLLPRAVVDWIAVANARRKAEMASKSA